jgi:hypothetical protein
MSEEKLKLLLNTMQEYGLRREVDPPVVLGGFLNRSWSYKPSPTKDELSRFLILKSYDKVDERIKVSGNRNRAEAVNILKDFLKQILWTNPEAFEERLKKKNPEEVGSENELKSITYNPLNRRLLGDIRRDLQIGQTLFECLNEALQDDKEKMNKIRKRLNSIEAHGEVEEKILETLYLLPSDKGGEENSDTESPRSPRVRERAKNYTSLFRQFGDDLLALLELDNALLSKSRILLYLEKITNLYALLYYLRIICEKTDPQPGTPPPGELPLVLPLCSNELEDRYKDYSDTCFQFYRQKSEDFWRSYLHERVYDNAGKLGCRGKDPNAILDEFSKEKNVNEIFGQIGSKIDRLKDEIESNLKELHLLKKSSLRTPVDKFTEAFLVYNLKGQRTLARMKLILDWQGAGAGIVAPEKVKGKHFHLKPELLETLVIVFYNRYRHQQDRLSLRDFIDEVRKRYGIILGPSENLEAQLKTQGLPVPQPSLLKRNFEHLISLLANLNMLERLSDKAMFIKCPFPLQTEES